MDQAQAFTEQELADIRAQIDKDGRKAKLLKANKNAVAALGHLVFAAYLLFSLMRAFPIFKSLVEAAKSEESSVTVFYWVFSGISAMVLLFFLVMEGRYLYSVVRFKGERIPAGIFPSAVYLLMLLSVANRFGIYTYPFTQIFPLTDIFLLGTAGVGILYALLCVIGNKEKGSFLSLLSLIGCAAFSLLLAFTPVGNLLSWTVRYSSGSKYSFTLKDISFSKTLTYMELVTKESTPLETNTLPLILALATMTVMVVLALLLGFRGKEKPRSLLVFFLCLVGLLGLSIAICPPTINVKGVVNVVADKATAALGIDADVIDALGTGLSSLGLSFDLEDVQEMTVSGLSITDAVSKLTEAAGSAIGGALGGEGDGLEALMGGTSKLAELINVSGISGTEDITGSISGMFDTISGRTQEGESASEEDPGEENSEKTSPEEGDPEESHSAEENSEKTSPASDSTETAEEGSLEAILNRVTVDSDKEILYMETDTGEQIPFSIAKPESPKMDSSPEKAFVCIYQDALTGEASNADVKVTAELFYLLLFTLFVPFAAGSLLCMIYLAAIGDEERKYSLLLWCKRVAVCMLIAVLIGGIIAISLAGGNIGKLSDESYTAECRFRPVPFLIGIIGYAAIAVAASIPWRVLKKRTDAISKAFREEEVA